MNDHKVIDTNELRSNKFTFSSLSEKTKNTLIAGGLSFAGIATAVGLSTLFISEKTMEDLPSPIPSESPISESTVTEGSDEMHEGEEVFINSTEEVEVETIEEYDIEVEASETTFTITFDTEAQFAHGIDNSMDFSTAFAQAREDVGHGGFFNWNGNSYSTYTEQEWNSMSYEDQQSFFSDVSSKSELDTNSWTIESSEPAIAIEIDESIEIVEPASIETHDEEIVEDDLEASSDFDTSVTIEDDVATITIVPPAAYGKADINDDNIVDAIAIDNNNDGKADLLALDEDFDGTYETFLINEDGDEDLDVFIIDQGADGIDDTDEIEEISDIVDMEDFIVIDEDDEALEGLDFIDDLIDIDEEDDIAAEDETSSDDISFDDPGL